MKRRSIIAACALVLTVLAGLGVATDGRSTSLRSANTSTLAIIGDLPYDNTQLAAFPSWVDEINDDPDVGSAVHLGDIKSGSTFCSNEYFATIAGLFRMFEDPFVYTPGDNEWTDCHRVNNGVYNPLERLAKVREVFFPKTGLTLSKKMHVRAQRGYPENVQWKETKTVFATFHVVGSNNSLAPWTGHAGPTPEQLAEANARIDATLAWIDDVFDKAEGSKARGVALMMQADTFEFDNENQAGFVAILDRIETRAAAFGRPVLLLQGDSHTFVVDSPFAGAANVTRIVVEGSATGNEWLKLSVDPRTPEVFSWERIEF